MIPEVRQGEIDALCAENQHLRNQVERLRTAITRHRKAVESEFRAETPTEPDAVLWATNRWLDIAQDGHS